LPGITKEVLAAAVDFEQEFQRAISAIAEAPERWPSYLSRCCRYILGQFPFSIVYFVGYDEGFLLAVTQPLSPMARPAIARAPAGHIGKVRKL